MKEEYVYHDTEADLVLFKTDDFTCSGCFYSKGDGLKCHRPDDAKYCGYGDNNFIYVERKI